MHFASFPLLLIVPAQAPERVSTDVIVFPASVESVWAALTEPEAIARALAVNDVRVELKPGGRIEWSGVGAAPLWQRRRVLAAETHAMLAFAFDPPAGTDERIARRAGQTWSVLYFEPLATDRTEVTVSTVAQGEGEDFGLAVERYAGEARAWVAAVQESFETSEANGASALAWAAVNDWVAGEWLAQRTGKDGKVRRDRVRLEPILGGQFLLEEFWSGDERELQRVARSIYGLDPRSRGTRCWTFAVDGTRAESTLRWEGDALVLRDTLRASEGVAKRIRSDGANAHVIETLVSGSSVDSQRFERVANLPADWKLADKDAVLSSPALAVNPELVPPDLQRTTAIVDASTARIWSELTSSASLAKLWNVAHASIEPHIGGAILTHYDETGALGDARGIRHEILALDPERMLAFRTLPPEDAPEFLKAWCAQGWHVVRLAPTGLECTRMTTTGCNYDSSKEAARNFFQQGNAFVQAGITQRFAAGAARPDALDRLAPLLGAEYDATTVTPTGEALRARTRWSRWCGPFVAWEGRLAPLEAEELADHTLALYGNDAERGPWFWKFGADGSVASGGLVAEGEQGVGHDWHSHAVGGQMRHIYVQIVPDDRDYTYRAQPSRDESTTIVALDYVRR